MTAAPFRRLTLGDCVGIGINGIIGSGIFLLPARVFAASGGLSWAAWFAIGGVCLLVSLLLSIPVFIEYMASGTVPRLPTALSCLSGAPCP